MTVVVKKLGGSVAILIPKAIAQDMALKEGTLLDISADINGIALRKKGRRPRRPLSQIVAEMDPAAYRRHNRELLVDPPVGKEIW